METFASSSENGKLLSRAIENTRRTAAAWTVRVQTITATATNHRSIVPTASPSTDLIT